MMRRRFFNMKDTSNKYLTIVALEDGLTASLSSYACEYCIDGDGNWITLDTNTATPSINAGQTLSFRGELIPTLDGIGTFTISKRCNLEGNCMSLLFGDNAVDNFSLGGKISVFYNLFYNCTTIINVSNDFLPATTLATYCYNSMFRGCTSLQAAPALPATTLANSCYSYMFQGCTSLQTAPDLSAAALVNSCYESMFSGCTNLNYIKMLATNISAAHCLNGWVYGVASRGTFVKNSAMNDLPIGTRGIPSGWTVENA